MKPKIFACVFAAAVLAAVSPKNALAKETQTQFFDGNKVRSMLLLEETNSDGKGFQFFCNNFYYDIYFTSEATAALREAQQTYLKDFEKRRLKQKDKNSLEKYGGFSIRVEWGGTRDTAAKGVAKSRAKIGYTFAKGSPYFAIGLKSARAENAENISPALQESGDVLLCFTRAQLKALLALL